MVRLSIFAIVLLVAQAIGVVAQSQDASGLRGSPLVAPPRTLAERRIDRLRGVSTPETEPADQGGDSGPQPDPFDDASANAADASDGFGPANDDGSDAFATPLPNPNANANANAATGAATGSTSQGARAAAVRVPRVAVRQNPEPAAGVLDGQTQRGDALTRTPQPPTDQPRSFPEREAADDAFVDQERIYDPVGLRLGSFVVLPTITVTGGHTDNTSQTNGGGGGQFYRVSPEVTARSDWSRHQLDAAFRGSFQGFPSEPSDDNPSANLTVNGRLDVGRVTTVNLGATYDLQREDQSNPDISVGDTDGILAQTFGGSLGITRILSGLIGVTVRGAVERELFSGGTVGVSTGSGGAIVTGADDRSNTEVLGTLRVSLESDAILRPFAETSLGRREFDGDGDALGFNRDSTIAELRGGTVLDLGPKLTGEVSVGYRNENVNDGNLEDLRGVVFDAAVTWSADRLTLLTLTGTTDFGPTTIDGATGSVVYSGALDLRRSLRKNLTLNAGLGLSYERFEGFPQQDIRTNVNIGLTWDLNRYAALTAQYNYDRLDSTSNGADYDANTVELGFRLRR